MSETVPTPNDMPDAAPMGVASTDTPAEEVSDTVSLTPNEEAANYRRRLRETETERDTLREQVTGFRRAEVERLAAERLADPSDLWREAQLEDLLDESGALDTEKVATALDAVLDAHKHWAKPTPATSAAPASTVTSADKIGLGEPDPTWQGALRGARRA